MTARAITRNEGRFVEVEVEVGSRWVVVGE